MEESNKSTGDVYELITNRIIAQLEQGVVPWHIPWTQAGMPKNLVTNRPYGGINVWLLASLGFRQNLFLTFKQAKALGGTIKKGQKACPVVYWNWKEKEDKKTGEIKNIGFLRYYMVFNIEQCEGVKVESEPAIESREHYPDTTCEEIIKGYTSCPNIHFSGSEAYYHPIKDIVQMPRISDFVDSEHYYATLFHELVHSTGHTSRLNRKELMERTNFGSKQYSLEELVAEMGASFLTSLAGIGEKPFDNHVAYIQNWLQVLENDKRFIIRASGKAQKAVDYMLGEISDSSIKEEVMEESSF